MMEAPTTSPSERPHLRPVAAVAAADRWSPSDGREAFLKRVAEYELQGLEKSQAFESSMAVFQADLFRVASHLEDGANETLVGRTTVASICEADAFMSPYLRVTRQIARNAQLEVRARCLGLGKRSVAQPRGQ